MGHPFRLLAIGFGLLTMGAVLPFLMILKFAESTFFLNFLAVACSIGGFTVGVLGITQYLRSRR